MVDLLVLLMAVLCLWGIRFAKPFFKGNNDDYLSVDNTMALRGVLAQVIILGHLAQRAPGGLIFGQLGRIGYLLVAVFFFLSGYGVQRQYMTRSGYAAGFLKKRIMSVGIPYLVVIAVYWGYHAWQGELLSPLDVAYSLINGSPVALYSWYIQSVLLFYVGFQLIMVLCGKKYGAMVVAGGVWYGLYTLFCVLMHYGNWWYISTLPVVIGMAWAVYEKQILKFLQKFYYPAVLTSFAGVAAALVFGERLGSSAAAEVVVKTVATTLFAVGVVLVLRKVKLGNPVLNWLGQVSMELYLLQGVTILLWRDQVLYIQNDLLYCVLALVTVVILAAGMHYGLKRIMKKPTR